MLTPPGAARQTFTHASGSAPPIVALARQPGPKTPAPQLMSSAPRIGPLTTTSGAGAFVVADTPWRSKASSQTASTAAITTGRYSGRHPGMTAVIAILSTVAINAVIAGGRPERSEEDTAELQSQSKLVCRVFFLNDTPTTELYTLSLPDALQIEGRGRVRGRRPAVEVEGLVADRLDRGDHDREVLGPAPGHDGVDRDLLDGRDQRRHGRVPAR